MALWILLNTTRVRGTNGTSWIVASETINDAYTPTAPILSAGGILVPATNAAAAAAAVLGQALKKQGAQPAQIDALMIGSVAGALASMGSVESSSAVAGSTVAAGAAISPNVTFTPQSSGNATVRAWASFAALSAGTITPVVKQGATTIAAAAQYTGAAGANPDNVQITLDVTGLTPGTAYTFAFDTTAGDATATLGHGSTGAAAGLSVTEHP
jgi:hypothetical protein